ICGTRLTLGGVGGRLTCADALFHEAARRVSDDETQDREASECDQCVLQSAEEIRSLDQSLERRRREGDQSQPLCILSGHEENLTESLRKKQTSARWKRADPRISLLLLSAGTVRSFRNSFATLEIGRISTSSQVYPTP